MSRFRPFTTSSTLPSIVLLTLSALNLTVVFHYWRGQGSILPADHYSLFCEPRSPVQGSQGLTSVGFQRGEATISRRSIMMTSTRSGLS